MTSGHVLTDEDEDILAHQNSQSDIPATPTLMQKNILSDYQPAQA